MSELRVEAATLRPTSAAVGASAVVGVGVLALALAYPSFGMYAVEAVALVASVLAAGLALFTAVLGDPTDGQLWWGRSVRVLSLLAFAATLFAVAFTVMVVAGNGLRGLGDSLSRDAVLRGATYEAALARCAGLFVLATAFTSVRLGVRTRRLAMLGGAVIVCGSFLLAGHARSHGPAALVMLCLLSHVLAVASWTGGLVGLAVVVRRRGIEAARRDRVVVTFAGLMTGVIAMLLAGGVGLSALYLSSWHALVATAYGQVLIVKTGLVGGLLLISASNHYRLVRPASTGRPAAMAMLRMNVALEQIGLVTVLLVTEVLLHQNPGLS